MNHREAAYKARSGTQGLAILDKKEGNGCQCYGYTAKQSAGPIDAQIVEHRLRYQRESCSEDASHDRVGCNCRSSLYRVDIDEVAMRDMISESLWPALSKTYLIPAWKMSRNEMPTKYRPKTEGNQLIDGFDVHPSRN